VKAHESSAGNATAKRDANPRVAVANQLQFNCQDPEFTVTNGIEFG